MCIRDSPYIAVRLRPGEDILEEMRTILQNMREDEPAAQKQE